MTPTVSPIAFTRPETSAISDAGLASIGKLRELRHLTVRSRDLTGHGASSLVGLARLEALWLAAEIDDAGLESICRLQGLRDLVLEDTAITDGGLAHLAGLKRCKRVWIKGDKITPEGMARVRAKCPWMEIEP